MLHHEPGDWGIVAPTYGAARDVCVEGRESGILAVLGAAVTNWNRSMGEVQVANGARIYIDGADDGAPRVQGKRFKGAWCDEVGLWRRWQEAWDESLAFAVTFEPAKIIATGTPKGLTGIPKRLVEDDAIPVTRLRTIDNIANLSPARVEQLRRDYEGTRLGRQELEGELLDDVEGALWTWEMIEHNRANATVEPHSLKRIVVAIDPAVSTNADSSETGIIVAGVDTEGEGYVLADRSAKTSPNGWAERAISAHEEYRGDRIVAERNNGGDMVESTIRTVDRKVPVKLVWASRGKHTRAEPIAALYEQGKIHHAGSFPDLESQLTGWTPDDDDSPDRLDALVWALTDLMLSKRVPVDLDPVSVTGQSAWR